MWKSGISRTSMVVYQYLGAVYAYIRHSWQIITWKEKFKQLSCWNYQVCCWRTRCPPFSLFLFGLLGKSWMSNNDGILLQLFSIFQKVFHNKESRISSCSKMPWNHSPCPTHGFPAYNIDSPKDIGRLNSIYGIKYLPQQWRKKSTNCVPSQISIHC